MPSLAELMRTLTPKQAQYVARIAASLPKELEGLDFPLNNTAMDRAAGLGFDIKTPRYHGTTADIYEFDPKKFGEKDPGWYGRGVTTDTDPEIADAYANYYEPETGQVIYPLMTRGNFMDWPEGQLPFATAKDSIRGTKDMEALGYAGTNMRNDRDLYGTTQDWQTEQVVFDPKNVRSRFAAFNPFLKNDATLLASHPIANALGLTGLAKMLESGKDVDLRQSINDYLNEGYDPAGLEKLTGVAPPTKKGDIAKEALMATDIGAPLSLAEMLDAIQRGDYKGAALSSLGAIPMVGAIKASHGSPHAFDKFDMSKIGTGEGAQAYGHGLYFAQGFDSPVAKQYRDALSSGELRLKGGGEYDPSNLSHMAAAELMGYGGDTSKAISDIQQSIKELGKIKADWRDRAIQEKQSIIDLINKGNLPELEDVSHGHLYNVSLEWPNAAREAADPLGEHHLLDWDKPIAEQPNIAEKLGFSAKTKDQIHDEYDALVAKNGYYHEMPPEIQAKVEKLQTELNNQAPNLTGEQFYSGNTENDYLHSVLTGKKFSKEQSDYLRSLGIPGIKYLDQGSRNAGAGTSNYVIFDQDIPKIISRNGVSLTDLLRR